MAKTKTTTKTTTKRIEIAVERDQVQVVRRVGIPNAARCAESERETEVLTSGAAKPSKASEKLVAELRDSND